MKTKILLAKEELRRSSPKGSVLQGTPRLVSTPTGGATSLLWQRRWERDCSVEGVPSNDLPDENKIKKITFEPRSSLTVPKALLFFF